MSGWTIVEWIDGSTHRHGIEYFPSREALDAVAAPYEYVVKWTGATSREVYDEMRGRGMRTIRAAWEDRPEIVETVVETDWVEGIDSEGPYRMKRVVRTKGKNAFRFCPHCKQAVTLEYWDGGHGQQCAMRGR